MHSITCPRPLPKCLKNCQTPPTVIVPQVGPPEPALGAGLPRSQENHCTKSAAKLCSQAPEHPPNPATGRPSRACRPCPGPEPHREALPNEREQEGRTDSRECGPPPPAVRLGEAGRVVNILGVKNNNNSKFKKKKKKKRRQTEEGDGVRVDEIPRGPVRGRHLGTKTRSQVLCVNSQPQGTGR